MDDKTDHLLAVVQGPIARHGKAMAVGDLFLTEGGLNYLSYMNASQLAGPKGTGASAVSGVIAGGVVGGVVAYKAQKTVNAELYRVLLLQVVKARALQFGLTLEERVRASWRPDQFATTIPKASIASLSIDPGWSGLTCVSRDGSARSWELPPLDDRTRQAIENWLVRMRDLEAPPMTPADLLQGYLPDPKEYGLELPYPAPVRLIELLAEGKCPEAEELDAIYANKSYVTSLFWHLTITNPSVRREACRALARARFQGIYLLQSLAEEALPRTQGCGIALLLFVFLPLGLLLLLLGSASSDPGFAFIVNLLGLMCLGFVVGMPVLAYRIPARAMLRDLSA